MGFFPAKQFASGSPQEDWEKKMRKELTESLENKMYTVKTRTGSRIMQKSPYIEYLISEEKIKRLKHEVPVAEEGTEHGSSVSKVRGEDEE